MTATVWNIDDPQHLSRVQVEFPFGKVSACRAWLHVLLPDAGGKTRKNRGFFFLPEKGDQVMLGFQNNHPSMPYVDGRMYHGQNTSGTGVQNPIKTISTRSGVTIAFDDSNGNLDLTDAAGSRFTMSGDGKISLYAADKISMEADDMSVISTHNTSISTNNLEEKVTGLYDTNAKNLQHTARSYQVVSNTNADILSNLKTYFQSKQVTMASLKDSLMHAEEKLIFQSPSAFVKSKSSLALKSGPKDAKKKVLDQIQCAKIEFIQPDKTNVQPDDIQCGFDWVRQIPKSGSGGDYLSLNMHYYQNFTEYHQQGIKPDPRDNRYVLYYGDFKTMQSESDILLSLKNIYKSLPISHSPKMQSCTEKDYFVPIMALFPGDTAELDVYFTLLSDSKIAADIEAIDIVYRNKLFDISQIQIPKGLTGYKRTQIGKLTIHCKASFRAEQTVIIQVKMKGQNPVIAGQLIIRPNSPMKKIKVAFIAVQTSFKSQNAMPKIDPKVKDFMIKFCRQALLDCEIIGDDGSLVIDFIKEDKLKIYRMIMVQLVIILFHSKR